MIAIIDSRMPADAKNNLAKYAQVVEFTTANLVYEAISGHPDIFFCKTADSLIAAPNLPDKYFQILDTQGIDYVKGDKPVGKKYPDTAIYNAVCSKNTLIHNLKITESTILGRFRQSIHINQGYSSCNLIILQNKHFITCDRGIYKTLLQQDFTGLYVDPVHINLPGMPHGFIGGACGLYQKTFYLIGAIKHLKEEAQFKTLLAKLNYELIELYDGPIIDGGTILFLE